MTSPHLFTLKTEKIMRETDNMDGCIIGETVIHNLRYADDTGIIAESEEQLQSFINVVVTESEEKDFIFTVQSPSLWCSQGHQ